MLYITMAALVSALDKMNNIQYGENNHIEYKWSEIQQEQILQLSFQLVRTTDVAKRHELAKKFSTCFHKGLLDERKILIKLLCATFGKHFYKIVYLHLFGFGKVQLNVKNQI